MAGFNKLPNSSSSSSSTTSSGGGGIYPTFNADQSYAGPPNTSVEDASQAEVVGGFNNDGDYITLPTSNTANITYSGGGGSWSGGIAYTDIDAAADNWVGFMLDETDGLLYACAVDTTATPDKFCISSIDSAGTITAITPSGGTAVTTDFSGATGWGTSGIGSSCLYRTSDGVGNLIVRSYTSATLVKEAVFNISTGALVSDTATVAKMLYIPYATADGHYISLSYSDIGDNYITTGHIFGKTSIPFIIPSETGLNGSVAVTGTDRILQWGGRVVIAGYTSNIYGPRAFTVAEFEYKTKLLAEAMGVAV